MVEFLQGLGLEGASVLEIGGGVGEIEIELLQAARPAQNLELSPAYEQQARTLAAKEGVQGRLDWRLHDLAQDPGGVAPADLVVLHRVVCCYPDYERLLGAAADHARRALVFSYPPRNPLSRAFYGLFNLVMRLTRSGFRGFAHPEGAMLAVLEDLGSADLPGSEPNLAGRWPGARFVGAALACVSCGRGMAPRVGLPPGRPGTILALLNLSIDYLNRLLGS